MDTGALKGDSVILACESRVLHLTLFTLARALHIQ